MALLPVTQQTPEAIAQAAQVWHTERTELDRLRPLEAASRRAVFGMTFPEPQEGSAGNRYDLGNGYELRGDYKINRTVDEAAFYSSLAAIQETGVIIARLFRFTPTLSVAEYRKLTQEQRAAVDTVLKIEPGLPSLELVKIEAPAAASVPTLPPAPAPAPVAAEPEFIMLEKARGWTREAFHAAGWTDAQLIETGHMEVRQPAPAPVAVPPPPAPTPAAPPAPAAVAAPVVPTAPSMPAPIEPPKPRIRGLFVDAATSTPYELFDAACENARTGGLLTEVTGRQEWESYWVQWQEHRKATGAASSEAKPAAATGEKPKRTRRTKEQIAADRAAGRK